MSLYTWEACVIATVRADSRFAPSQWETALLCNDVSHWLGANLESALIVWFLRTNCPEQYDFWEHLSPALSVDVKQLSAVTQAHIMTSWFCIRSLCNTPSVISEKTVQNSITSENTSPLIHLWVQSNCVLSPRPDKHWQPCYGRPISSQLMARRWIRSNRASLQYKNCPATLQWKCHHGCMESC